MLHNKNSKTKLSDNYSIISGYSFRQSITLDKDGNVRVLQANDLADSFLINTGELSKIDYDLPISNAFLQENDVILSSRGVIRASVVEDSNEKAIASSSVFILRPATGITDEIISEYLALYLNSSKGQSLLSSTFNAGTIQSIKKSDLESVQIAVPPVKVQQEVCNLNRNIMKQSSLLKTKLDKTKEILNGVINLY